MPLYFGDFLAATALWKGDAQALYLLLLGYQWSAGPLPPDLPTLASVVRYELPKFLQLWPVIAPKFETTSAGLVNARLEVHRNRAIEISEKRAASGRKGGTAKRSSKVRKQSRSKNKANATELLKQNGSTSHDFVTPSNPIQTKRREEEEAHEEGKGGLQ